MKYEVKEKSANLRGYKYETKSERKRDKGCKVTHKRETTNYTADAL